MLRTFRVDLSPSSTKITFLIVYEECEKCSFYMASTGPPVTGLKFDKNNVTQYLIMGPFKKYLPVFSKLCRPLLKINENKESKEFSLNAPDFKRNALLLLSLCSTAAGCSEEGKEIPRV